LSLTLILRIRLRMIYARFRSESITNVNAFATG